MIRILVIEDEKSVITFLINALEKNNSKVFTAFNGNDGIQQAIENRPEIIILDLGLPDISGIEVLKNIRSWSSVPIIILTANSDDNEKIKALDLGADDYLTKPYSIIELEARMRAVLRRFQKHETILNHIDSKISLNIETHQVFINNQEIHLSLTEFLILKLLLINQGKIVTHRLMLKEIWGPNSTEHTQYLRVYVGQLRKKLQEHQISQEFIATEVGVGYRLK